MRVTHMRTRWLLAATSLLLFSTAAWPQEAPAPTVVLDQSGFWRVHFTLQPPVVRENGKLRTLDSACRTDFPEKDWMLGDFLDVDWDRLPGAPFASHNSWSEVSRHNVGFVPSEQCSPCLAGIAMRGKFEATDPAKVSGLTLSVAYRGGIVVTLNGVEIARGNLPAGKIAPDALAEPYPVEAYVKPDGNLLICDSGEKDKDVIARWESRTRRIEKIDVPARLLRRGLNVLSLEIHRAPYDPVLWEKTRDLGRNARVDAYMWSTCGLVTARLSAEDARGLVPNVVRPTGFRVWNSPACMPDFDMDYPDRTEPLRPVRIVAARGGLFSAKVVAGSDAPIEGLKATMSDLVCATGGKIASSKVRVRYAIPSSWEPGAQRRYPAEATLCDALVETPPAEVPVREKKWVRGNWVHPGQPTTRFGAVMPIWITVDVPMDAPPGDYRGSLTISAAPASGVVVPVEMKLTAFTLPPGDRLSTTVDFIQSPESVAMQYDVPLWSDRHFALLAESFKRLGEVGNWSIYIPIICRTNEGNVQSMVRWVRQPDGTWTHDFSIVERYVDLALKHMGRPRMVVLHGWDHYMGSTSWRGEVKEGGQVPVSVLDPKAGTVTETLLPPMDEKESLALWKPVGEGLRALLRKRGLEGAMMLGISTDSQPSPGVVGLYKQVLPGVPWMRHAHGLRKDTHGVPLAYQCVVWSPKFVERADAPPLHGWANAENIGQFCRSRDIYPVLMARLLGEMNIQGAQRGFGRIGLDFWPVLPDRSGRRRGSIHARFPETAWANLDWMIRDFVPPGPDGALSTTRIVMMREGIQECEARIVIERALVDEKLRAKIGDALAKRAETLVADRTRAVALALDNHMLCGFGPDSLNNHSWWSTPGMVGNLWYIGSNPQRRTEELYTLAGEIAAAIGKP